VTDQLLLDVALIIAAMGAAPHRGEPGSIRARAPDTSRAAGTEFVEEDGMKRPITRR